MAKYLTQEGLAYYHEGMKGKLAEKIGIEKKADYDVAYEHSQSAHAPSNAQANVIEKIKQNGIELSPTGKTIDISVPTKISELDNDEEFIKKTIDDLDNYFTRTEVNAMISAIATMQSVTVAELPTENISTTTIYLLEKSNAEESNIYDEYLYINGNWEKIGDTKLDLSDYVNDVVSNGSGNAITAITKSGNKITVTKGSTFADSTHNHDSVYAKAADIQSVSNTEIDAILAS